MTNQSRQPAGTPTGGRFAPTAHDEPTAALDPEPAVHTREFFDAEGLTHAYAEMGFSADDGYEWWAMNFYPGEAQAWRDAGFTPEEADAWHDGGMFHSADAAAWRDAGATPNTVRSLSRLGWDPAEINYPKTAAIPGCEHFAMTDDRSATVNPGYSATRWPQGEPRVRLEAVGSPSRMWQIDTTTRFVAMRESQPGSGKFTEPAGGVEVSHSDAFEALRGHYDAACIAAREKVEAGSGALVLPAPPDA